MLMIKHGGLVFMNDKQLSIIIAYKEDSEYRKEIFHWQISRYKKIFSNVDIVIGEDDSNHDHFCKARAINNAVKNSRYDNLFIVDIDLVVEKSAIEKGIKVINKHCYIIPYGSWWKLSKDNTRAVLDNKAQFNISPQGRLCKVHPRRGTGIHIISKHNFYAAGGYDERFIGWGGEDNAFGIAVRTMCKQKSLILKDYTAYHLWHPFQVTKKGMNQSNIDLWRKYQKADKKPVELRQLLRGRRSL